MRLLLLLGILLPLSIFAGNIPALSKLQKTFQGKKGFDVNFVQEVAQSTFKDQRNLAEGFVHFSRPNHLKWSYEKPKKRVIEYDGKKLVITEGTEKQEAKETGPLNLQESFSFLWGETNQNLYKIESLGGDSFRIRPKNSKGSSFKTIEVHVTGGKVVEARVENNLEGTSVLKFTNWQLF